MDRIGRIRRLHSRGKKSERDISQVTGLSRNTIVKWIKAPLEGGRQSNRGPVLVTALVPRAGARRRTGRL